MARMICFILKPFDVLKRQEGQGMAEYGLVLALVAIIAIAGLTLLGPKLKEVLTSIANQL